MKKIVCSECYTNKKWFLSVEYCDEPTYLGGSKYIDVLFCYCCHEVFSYSGEDEVSNDPLVLEEIKNGRLMEIEV
jgi:hypothetical protein